MRGPRRQALAVTALVLIGHLWLVSALQSQLRLVHLRAEAAPQAARLQVQFVRVLQPKPPAPVGVLPRVPLRPPRGAWLPVPVVPALAAASAPAAEPIRAAAAASSAAPASVPGGPVVPDVPEDAAPTLADGLPAVPMPAASGPAFDWPPSTRVRYTLKGSYRGPVDGSAQVEWLHRGDRYQVFLDVTIGASFAPLLTRQMRSEGRIGAGGLRPTLFEERTRLLWRDPQAFRIDFEPEAVRLPGNRRVARPAGLQDAVSQFVQLTWRFTLDPALLVTGRVLNVPLALPSGVSDWTYDVGMAQTFYPPSGPVDAVHVQAAARAASRRRPGGRDVVRPDAAVPAGADPDPPGRRQFRRPADGPSARAGGR